MRDTAFWTPDHSRLATAYVPTPDGLQVWDNPDGRWGHAPAFGDGAAGLVSTVDDLLAFARMFLAEGAPVLSADAVAKMTSDQLTAAQRAVTGEAFLHGRSWGLCQSVITEGPTPAPSAGMEGSTPRGWSTPGKSSS
jgi:CubicO group peptidase (beta-lactamase class C family)